MNRGCGREKIVGMGCRIAGVGGYLKYSGTDDSDRFLLDVGCWTRTRTWDQEKWEGWRGVSGEGATGFVRNMSWFGERVSYWGQTLMTEDTSCYL